METGINYLHGPNFWRKIWDEAKMSSLYVRRVIRSEKEVREKTINFWNRFAPTYGIHSVEQEKKRVANIIDLLERKQMLTPDTDLLDVGCGPGNYSLPLARRVKSVTALDGAVEMCRILEQNAREANQNNISVLHQMWEDVDLKQESMYQKFDLVFASMTPAVCNYDTLVKLIQASREYCCLIWWAGWTYYEDQLIQELWQLFFQEELNHRGFDIIYPYNLLYSMGYAPTMDYEKVEWTDKETVEQVIERLCHFFWLYMEINQGVRDVITRHVQERVVDGVFRQTTSATIGIITFRVDGCLE